jgi:CRISPR-associated endonuclease Csy4
MARRKAKREDIDFDQAFQLLQSRKEILIESPFIKVASGSSGQRFKLFIIKEHASEQIKEGFSCYGLSAKSTIPDF